MKQVIIVAGGKGRRMNSNIPKQFIELSGKPVLMHTIQKFYSYQNSIKIIVVLPEDQINYWRSLCKSYDFKIEHLIIKGGSERFYSVKNGLSLAKNEGLIAIHDAVRPLVSLETIASVFSEAERSGNAIAVDTIDDSIRKITNDLSEPFDRNALRRVQTPQCFHSDILKEAYGQEYKKHFTDDATVVESKGVNINMVQGNRENLKITNSIDLKIAELLLCAEE
jgi:2-C-methyl-D-erythritol 4-phosphate cytidylyltransferase